MKRDVSEAHYQANTFAAFLGNTSDMISICKVLRESRHHIQEFVLFLVCAVLIWGEIAVVRWIVSGQRPGVSGFLYAALSFTAAWLLSIAASRVGWESESKPQLGIAEVQPIASETGVIEATSN